VKPKRSLKFELIWNLPPARVTSGQRALGPDPSQNRRSKVVLHIDGNGVSQDLITSRVILPAIRKLVFWSSDVPNF
jgi:hypothetical protein